MGKPIDRTLLICPHCKSSELNFSSNIICGHCQSEFVIKKGIKYIFCNYSSEKITDSFDKIKYYFKKYYKLYNLIMKILGPVYGGFKLNKYIREHITDKNNVVAINLGSGNSDLSDGITNIDIFDYDNVDMACDITNIPIKDNSVDSLINVAVLEHIKNPAKAVSEFNRVLKPGGAIFCFFPFMQGFHASPYDYSRMTKEGLKHLFADFEIVNIWPTGGPTSALLWIFQEWVAILLSFGMKPLHTFIYLLTMMATFPLKYLDSILILHPQAQNIASGFTIIARKK